MARRLGAEVTALHVAPPATGGGSLSTALQDLVASAGDAGITVRVAVTEGDPFTSILEQAEALPADLIVMGTHGRRGFDRWVLGSVTERVLHRAPCPVMTVNGRAETPGPAGPFATVLCAEDLTSPSAVLPYAISLVRQGGGRLVVFHAVEEVPEAGALGAVPFEFGPVLMARARERLHAAIPAAERERGGIDEAVVCGRAYKQILLRAAEEKADLIVMGVHGGQPINDLFFGSTTHHVVRGASCPVLTVRGPRGEEIKE
jgi:nucleotide-binding universal stress UspA family protein